VKKPEHSSNKVMDLDEVIKKLENCCVYKHDSLVSGKK
jgi:hypothetical protein